MEFEIALSKPGKVMENGKSGSNHGIVIEFYIYLQNYTFLFYFQCAILILLCIEKSPNCGLSKLVILK